MPRLSEQLHALLGAVHFPAELERHKKRRDAIAEALAERAQLEQEEAAHRIALDICDPTDADIAQQAERVRRLSSLNRVRIGKAIGELVATALEMEEQEQAAGRWTPSAWPEPITEPAPVPQSADADFGEERSILDDDLPARPLLSVAEITGAVNGAPPPPSLEELRFLLRALAGRMGLGEMAAISTKPALRADWRWRYTGEQLEQIQEFERLGCLYLAAKGAPEREAQPRYLSRHPAIALLVERRREQLNQTEEINVAAAV